jgi:outer membrane protein assembly factor BamB
MMRRPLTVLLGALLLVGWVGFSAAEDWPGWRGADRSGVSPEKGLLKEWPKEGPKLLWKASGIGSGYSSPAVVGGKAYILGGKGSSEYLFAFDVKEGKELWRVEVGPQATGVGRGGFGGGGGGGFGGRGMGGFPGPRSSPTVGGDFIYVLGSPGTLACVEAKSGDKEAKVVWKKKLTSDFDGRDGMHHYAESPLLDGDTLVCTPGGSKATMVALNKKTGDVLWKSEISGGNAASYSSAIIGEVGGVKQYVQFLSGGVVGVSARDGKLLWRYDKTSGMTNAATPVFHDGYVFCTTGGGFGGGGFGGPPGGGGFGGRGGRGGDGGSALVQLVVTDGKVEVKEVYKNKNLPNYHGGVVRVGDYIYGTNSRSLVCLDFKTGEKKWDDRCVGQASVIAADGMLYVRGENGEVALVEATPEGYREKGRFETPSGRGQSFPHPVLADGKLFLHDGDTLLCYDLKAK